MVICKFFQNGNCRYGDGCYNEHIRPGGGNAFSQSGNNSNNRRPLVQPAKFSGDLTGTGFSFTRALNDPSAGQVAPKSTRFGDSSSTGRYAGAANPFATNAGPGASTTGFSFTQTLNQIQAPVPSVFGGSTSGPFSSPVAGQQQQQQSLFSQATTFPQSPPPAFGAFSQPAFGQSAAPAFGSSGFGQPATFASPVPGMGSAFSPAPAFGPASGGFGQPAFGTSPMAGAQSPFGQQIPVVSPPPAFGQTSGFGMQSPPAVNQQSLFGQVTNQTGTTGGSVFGQAVPAVPQPQVMPSASDLFSQTKTYNTGSSGSSFFGNTASESLSESDATAYSRDEELSPEDLAAFQSATFEFGKIPILPPPIHLCS